VTSFIYRGIKMKRHKRLFLILGVFIVLLSVTTALVTIYTGEIKGRGGLGWEATVKGIESSVQAYCKAHDGESPIVNSTVISVNGSKVIEGKDYYVIAVCRLVGSNSRNGVSENALSLVHARNCLPEGANAEPYATNCLNRCEGSYVWLTTTDGEIASICVGPDCTNHNEDGFQDVYP
jgi:hypothetical protein